MLIYLLKSSACLAIFMIFYKLVLEKISVHTFKRFYLLSTLLLAFTIPSITFIEYIEPLVLNTEVFAIPTFEIIETLPEETLTDYTPIILWTVYGLGVFIFLLKFCINLYRIISRIKNNPKYKSANFINVLVKNLLTPHTFFNYIFLNKHKFENSEIPIEIILHEQTHAKQKHSIDVLILEISQIIFWFNPLIYLLKRDVKLNHEFLADRAVLHNGIQPSAYQQLLLAFSSNANEPQLANAINYSSIKKRFTVMKTKTSKTSVWLRSLLILPLIAVTLYGFSEKIEVEKELHFQDPLVESLDLYLNDDNELIEDNNVVTFETIENLFQINNKLEVAIKYNLNNKSIDSETLVLKLREIGIKKITICSSKNAVANTVSENNQKATQEQIDEYNRLAKHYNSQPKDARIIKKTDIERLETLYNIMSDEQKKDAQPFPECPAPPAPPKVKKADDIKTGFLKVNGVVHYYVNIKNTTKYYNRNGFEVSKSGNIISDSQINGTDVIPGQYITKVYSDNKLVVEFKDNNSNAQQSVVDIPSPPKPISRLDHIINMAKKDATFFYEGKNISSDKAIELIKNNDDLNIFTKDVATNKPRVFLTTDTNIPKDYDAIKKKPLSAKKI